MFSLFTSFFGGIAGRLAIVGVIAVSAFFAGYKVESWHWSASLVAVAQHNAAIEAAQQAKVNDAEQQAMVQLNDLNSRLVKANAAAKAHPATGTCLPADSVRNINSAIGGPTGSAR